VSKRKNLQRRAKAKATRALKKLTPEQVAEILIKMEGNK
jgi:hypothetical protein